MILIWCGTIFIIFEMTNNFYNININKYNPVEHSASGQASSPVQADEQKSNQYIEPHQNYDEVPFEEYGADGHSRLNALDSTILVNEAYQNIDDEVFKTEYQIDKLEQGIKLLDKEISDAKAINDFQKADILTMRKHSLQERLKVLNSAYGESDVTTKLSSNIAAVFNIKPTFLTKTIDKCVDFISEKILSKISPNYNSGKSIKTALNKLETLNKNVDELVTMQTPYGEADERYDMLSEYLNRANVIHFNISKTVGTPTFFDTISSIDQAKFSEARKNSSNFGNMTARPNHHKMKPEGIE